MDFVAFIFDELAFLSLWNVFIICELAFSSFEMTRRNLKFRRQASLDSQYPKQGAKILRFQLCVSSVVSIVEL